jgi:hypothetical protein
VALPNPIVEGNTLVIPAIQSDNFQTDSSGTIGAATQGWQIARDGTATFTNLNLLGDIGAGNISADLGVFSDIQLPNYDSLDTTLDGITLDLSGRCIGFFQQTDGSLTGVTGTLVQLIMLDCFMQPNRIYSVHGMCRIQPSAIDTNDQWQVLIKANAGAGVANPGTGSGNVICQTVGSLYQQGYMSTAPFDSGNIPADTPLRLSLVAQRLAGTATLTTGPNPGGNTVAVAGTAIVYTFRYAGSFMYVLDHGPSTNMPLFVGYNSTDVVQPPVTPPAPAPKTYTKTYYATWSRTYDGDSTTTWDDTPYCYQGYYSSTRGNTRSLVGFNYAQIASDLSGATINSCKLTVKGAHAYYNNGYTLEWGTHNYTAKPSTWGAGNVHENRGSLATFAAGETATISLGTSIGGEFKSQVSRGISFGPGPSTSLTYYGYCYGATQSGKPYLTITYTK